MEIEELVGAQERKFEPSNEHDCIKRRETEAKKHPAVELPKSAALVLPDIRSERSEQVQCGKQKDPAKENNSRLIGRPRRMGEKPAGEQRDPDEFERITRAAPFAFAQNSQRKEERHPERHGHGEPR